MATFGEGNSTIGKDDILLKTFNGFSNILLKLLPKEIEFIKISVRVPDIVLVTRSGDFMIDAASGGVSTIIDIAWRIYMFSLDKEDFTVTMDEPENHLHPTMQRSILRKLVDAFPKAQFIVATHSPFIVSSVKDSYVYVLRYAREQETSGLEVTGLAGQSGVDPTSRVKSVRLETIDKAGSASEILREVLGVPVTMPEWVEEGLTQVTNRFVGKEITKETLSELRRELIELGYGEYFPEALANVTAPA